MYTETLAREALSPDEGRPRLLSLSCSFSEGTVADLQIYREGKHICGLDLDVTRERERERKAPVGVSFFLALVVEDLVVEMARLVFERLEDVFLSSAMFCIKWKDRFV